MYHTAEDFGDIDFSDNENMFTDHMQPAPGTSDRHVPGSDDCDDYGFDDDEDLLHEIDNMNHQESAHFDW